MVNIDLEVRLFLSSVIWGIGLVILYDCLRIFRRIIIHNRFWSAVEDLLYWIVSGVLIFHMMYEINDGAIRGFAILGVVIGMVLYHYSISNFLVRASSKGIHKCIHIVHKVTKFITKPLVWLGRRIKWFCEYILKIGRKPCRTGKKSLKKIWKQVKIAVVKK